MLVLLGVMSQIAARPCSVALEMVILLLRLVKEHGFLIDVAHLGAV